MKAEIEFVGKNKVKVVIYVRVSTQEQAKEGYSIGEQIERLTKYCEAMGWVIVETYIDPGYSGGSTERPGLQKMIKAVEEGGVDKVVVYKLDRLSRSQKDTLLLIEDVFLKNGTDFVSMNENFDTSTPFGRAMIGILAVFAQLEREQIKERMGMGKEARAKDGKWKGGMQPIGYDFNMADDKLEINSYEAMQLHELSRLFLGGIPLRTIETMFIEKGYKHKYGVWSAKQMRRALGNKLYLGLIRHHDEWYPGDHEPIFDEITMDKHITLLEMRAEQYKLTGVKPGQQTTYLGGLLYCKRCGAKYAKVDWPQRNGSITTQYGCYSRTKRMKAMIKDPNCKNKYWRRNELDNLVFDEIRQLALDPSRVKKEKTVDNVEDENESKIALIEKEIEKIDAQISRFLDLYGLGRFSIEQLSSKTDPLNETRAGLVKELEALNAEAGKLSAEEAVEIASTLDEALKYGDFDEVRSIVESLIFSIELDGEDVHIRWKLA